MKIYPSLISADLLGLRDVLKKLNPVCDGYHVDIMDDHFVPNLTWGPAFVEAIGKETTLPLHIHLMVIDPTTWESRITWNSKDTLIFHIESFKDERDLINDFITDVQASGARVGIAFNPVTPVEAIKPWLDYVSVVLVMSVTPGFSGQKFIDITDKVKMLKDLRDKHDYSYEISVDGGVNAENIEQIQAAGADSVGVAAAIFFQKDTDYVQALKDLQKIVKKQ